uniref:RNA polymerase sigma factor n=1 Tax=Thermorudis peleae TaxID=1382356 RepID=A0A831TDT4_9BACT
MNPPPRRGLDHDAIHTERRLSTASRSRDADTFNEFVDQYYAPLRRYLLRLTGDPELAADLTQEAFLKAYSRIEQLADDGAFRPWLYRIALNLARMEFRRRQRRRVLSLEWLIESVRGIGHWLVRPDDMVTVPTRDLVQQVLDELSPTLREALLLHRLAGFTSEEIARLLNISPEAARKRVTRAVQRFQALYHERAGAREE